MTLQRVTTFGLIVGALFVTALSLAYLLSAKPAFGSAPPGLPATIATSSVAALPTNSAQVIFATSSCSARIVTTASTTLMLTFTDKDTPTAIFGVFQAASTTAVYDSGQYGCGQVRAFSFGAGAITVMDSR